MSDSIMGMVFRTDLPRVEKFVLLAIADHVDQNGRGCFASLARIVFKTGYDVGYVQRALKNLRARGMLVLSHKHPEYGVDVWDIDLTTLVAEVSFETWVRTEWPALMTKRSGRNGNARGRGHDSVPEASARPGNVANELARCENKPGDRGELALGTADDGAVSPQQDGLSRNCDDYSRKRENDHRTIGNGSKTRGNSSRINYPSQLSDMNHPEELSRQGRPGAPPAPTKPFPPPQDKHPHPAQARAPGDGKIGRAPLDEELAEEASHRPQTALQDRVTRLCNARYLTDSMLAKLQSPLTVVRNGGPPQTYPSPEEEWQSNPGLFAEYVDLCARRIREESGRPPSRSDLIQTVRRYERRNTGWLDFKASQARASPRAALPWYVTDPDTPSWMR